MLRERERQRKAKEYYDVYYTEYSADEFLTFSGEEPTYPISINKISCDTNGFPVHFINIREDGSFITPRTMQHVSKIIKKDIFKDFDFHSLRLTHASMLAEMGADSKYIQTRLGHANMKTTVNNQYGHTKIKLELKQSNQCKVKVGTPCGISTFCQHN